MVKNINAVVALVAAILTTELSLAGATDKSNCEPLEKLGKYGLDRFHYSISMKIDDECSYSLSLKMKHDPNLPLPSEASQCDPTIIPPAIAPDGLPYFAFRWAYQTVPDYIKRATGIDHISVDWNPCGHPPMNVFTVPHYDFHIYLVKPEYRSCMTCDTIPGAPACDPGGQSTSSGKAFFNVNKIISGANEGKIANMPDNFVVGLGDFIPLMGGHAYDRANEPTSENWVNPIWIMGPYDGTLVDYEPMVPLPFFNGSEDKYYEESLNYLGQSIDELPSKYSVSFDATSGFMTISLEGKSAICRSKKSKKTKSSKNATKTPKNSKGGN